MSSFGRLCAVLTMIPALVVGSFAASAQGFDIFRKPAPPPPAQSAAPAQQKGQRPAAAPQAAPKSGGFFPAPPAARTTTAPARPAAQPARRQSPPQQAAQPPARRPIAPSPFAPPPQTVQPASAPANPFRLFDFFRRPQTAPEGSRPDRPSGWPFGGQAPVEMTRPRPQTPPPQQQQAVPPPAARPAKPVKPAVEITAWVFVLGDSIADNLASGLNDALDDRPEISIRRRIRAPSGLTEEDGAWAKSAAEIAQSDRLTYVVIELGSRDNAPMMDGDREIALLSEEWKQRYAARVDAMLEPFKAKGTKVFWVGAPPMRDTELSADLVAINDIIKERVGIAGQTYIDVWEGFVDESDAYAQTGPDLEGREVRLRMNDGMHFTRAGSRKLAHYVERDIRRHLDEGDKPALPAQDIPALSGAEQPDAGPLIVLTAPALAADGQLVGDGAAAKPAEEIERVLLRGEEIGPVAGRMDDASWRPPGSLPVVALATDPFGPPTDPQGPLLAGASPSAAVYSTATPSESRTPTTPVPEPATASQ